MKRQLQRVLQQGLQDSVRRRQKSWVYWKRSGHFFHTSWRATGKESSRRPNKFSPPTPEKKKLSDVTKADSWSQTTPGLGWWRRGSARQQDDERQTVCPSVAEAQRLIAGGGGGRRRERSRTRFTPGPMPGGSRRWRQTARGRGLKLWCIHDTSSKEQLRRFLHWRSKKMLFTLKATYLL